MGGAPRKPDKPRPSYEDGRLRDPEIAEKQQPTNRDVLLRLIRKAVERTPEP